MPSLRQKVTTYFRQFSFITEREERTESQHKTPDGSFMTRYLDGSWKPPDSVPKIISMKNPDDMPDYNIGKYQTGHETVTAAYTGPDEGLTGVRRKRVHLSAGPEIDFIDTFIEQDHLNETNIEKKDLVAGGQCSKNDLYAINRTTLRKEEVTRTLVTKTNSKERISNKAHLPFKRDMNLLSQSSDHINDNAVIKGTSDETVLDPIANVKNWNTSNDHVYGLSVSLYEKHALSCENVGNPIADCFGVIARENSCIMAIADGVNWGDGARLAARCAVQASLEYLNSAIFGIHQTVSTKDIFVSLIRSFWEAHAYIIEAGGALTTLTVLVVLPLSDQENKSIVCCCNVGDSLGFVYSKINGVREITEGSHDVNSMRDIRDALGALGPVNGDKPEMTNLTLSLTIVEKGDIVFLTSDGISDNFDPVVGKFAEPILTKEQSCQNQSVVHPRLAPKRQNKSASSIMPRKRDTPNVNVKAGVSANHPVSRPDQSTQKHSLVLPSQPNTSRTTYTRSKTFIEPRISNNNQISRFSSLPLVTGKQRHQLILLRMADLLMYGINGTLRPCSSAKQLCQLLIDFVTCITSAKRKLLEQRELYYKVITDKNGFRKEIELNKQQHRVTRRRMVEGSIYSSLPGKLDHATVVAYTVGDSRVYNETNL